MSKKKNSQAESTKWFGRVLSALKALGGPTKLWEIGEWIVQTYNKPDEDLNARYQKSRQLKFPNQAPFKLKQKFCKFVV